ncbi:MAG: signal peptidase I [Brevundimonas sp.]|nr:signal peptidase I [Brevundimonas sp.]
MSDEHKPHDEHDHGHDHAHAPDTPVEGAHEADPHAVEHAPAAVEAISDGDDHGHAPEDHVHAESAPVDEAEPVAAEVTEDVHVDHTLDPVEAVSDGDDHTHAEPSAPAAEAAPLAAVAATAAASDRKPIWSDAGDAPFEEPAAPIYDRKARKKGRKSGGSANETVEIFKTVFFALLIALVIRVFLFQPFTIPSASMEPNLYEGDYIVVSKWSYGYSKHSIPFSPGLFQGRILDRAPKRGDIVVFKLPRDNKTDYIKRLIGLPGDTIQMRANRLYINNELVPDVVLSQSQVEDMFGPRPVTRLRETLPGGKTFTIQDWGPGGEVDDTGVYSVPAGHYFMMGDNRDNSVDSRYDVNSGVGLVPAENLVGKAEIILFSWTPGASLLNPVSWFANVRPSRFFTVLD